MYKLYYILFAIAISATAFSQNTIKGKVIDAETQEPIFSASIYFSKLDKGSMSSVDGDFTIVNIPEGNHELVISSLGYATQTFKIKVPSNQDLLILLQPTAIEMEAVIVSTPFHQLQSENVVKVERATVGDLQKAGAITLADGITQLPGVESITTGSGIGKPVIRGLSANRVLVYTQGVRLENQQFGDEHGLGVSSSGVESVEVIKGPASLLYGSDALGGVLYLNPEKYAASNVSSLDAAVNYFTNTLGTEANIGFKTSGNKFKYLLRGNYATHSDYKTGGGKRVTNSRFTEKDLKAGIGYQNNKYRGDLRYNYNNTLAGIPEEIGAQTTSKTETLPNQKLNNHILSFDNKVFLKNSSFNFKLGYIFNDRKEFEEPEDDLAEDLPALEMHLETLNYDLKYNAAKWGNFETIFGIQGMFQTNKNFGEELLIPDAKLRDFGILATTHLHLDNIDLQAGLRFDNRNLETNEYGMEGEPSYFAPVKRDFNSYNGALGAKYNILKSLTARLNLATGFRAPNLSELTSNGTHEGTNRYEIGNADLKNEQNFQIDLALEYRNEHFEIFANAFYNKVNNYIYLNPTSEFVDENPVFRYVQDDAKLYGGEAGMHIHPHPLDWLHIESSLEMVKGEQDSGKNLPLIPATSITNTLRMEFEKTMFLENPYSFISLKSTLAQNKVSDFETNSQGYSLLNAGIGGNFNYINTNFNVRISANNILDKAYISHLSRLKPDNIPNMGRNISLSISAKI
ncbi:TonB-dependent receptor [Gillisia sp. M10.2A]|uniref:TonB-dependent receptor n=1 Tax=Gillisia lutea TaxID=2909668 RepID=A0ABS9EHE4_9FLAO|nr:TonB-dependent receptor [Gillisia lutea]MCF4101737.1 TonB-dependent receptor [Gillisia lutea]